MRNLKGIADLVKLFKSENQEVRRYATGAARNVIYENMENKMTLIDQGGIENLVDALGEQDDELRKNITGTETRAAEKDPDSSFGEMAADWFRLAFGFRAGVF